MLNELHISQFALIEQLTLTLQSGTTVFTGETGAGKSIVVDALGAVFGTRARTDWVRHGANKAEITALLTLADRSPVIPWLQQQALDDENQLMLRRIISADGRSRAWINGTPCPLKILQQLGDMLLDLHGQHEHQALLQPDYQRLLIDGALNPTQLTPCTTAWHQMQHAEQALAQWEKEQSQLEREAAWMQSELTQLEELRPTTGLTEQLEQEIQQLRHAGSIQQAAADASVALDEHEPCVRDGLSNARHLLAVAKGQHAAIDEADAFLNQAELLVAEAIASLRPAIEVSANPAELDRLESRIAQLQQMSHRHHTDAAGLMELMEHWQRLLSRRERAQWDRSELEQKVANTEAAWREQAGLLHQARALQAAQLTTALRPLLDRLGLATMQIEIQIEADEDHRTAHGIHGWDRVRLIASSNPGEPFRLLADIASGGELSRIVLALKGCGALRSAPEIAVFDEVDVGIGGETAWCVGELLATMGEGRQVLLVSHLPQVAASTHHQLHIRKQQHEGRTISQINPLNRSQRCQEIARMLGGADAASLTQAEAMLARGEASRCPS
ncbi:MAG: DNA repair protein RecN [Mariprofundales bacterium]|nr:DNA repair protein RecN [Mariprofundales bacterium]